MVEAILSKNTSPLLSYVVSRLRPEVFSHPIWVYFGKKVKPFSSEIIEELLNAAKQLQDFDPGSACQVLLICTVYQNYSGQRDEALRTTQQILSLAERQGLAQEIVWATWGACAICVQKGDLEQATNHLQQLQNRLRAENDWILANFIETVEQSMATIEDNAIGFLDPPQDGSFVSPMHLIFYWLRQWGFSAQFSAPEFQVNSDKLPCIVSQKIGSAQTLSLGQRWRRYWHTAKQAVRGEIKLQWVAKNVSPRTSHEIRFQAVNSPPSHSPHPDTSQFLSSHLLTHDHPRIKPDDPLRLKIVPTRVSLFVYCLGPFRVYQDEEPIDDWPSSKGKAIFKYLVTHRERPVFKDVLMDLFWPDTSTESARNNLNVAVYGLRQALRKNHSSYSHVLFIDDCYLLNPEIFVWLDCEAFLEIIKTARELESNGDLKAAINEYGKAETLYQGEFLAEDRYEDWLLPLREKLQTEYLNLLDRLNHHFFEKQDYQACIHMCRKMLAIDPCSEEAHRHLMRCFYERGQSYLAIRQYYLCAEALKEGLDITPANTTKELYEYIHSHS